MEKKKVTALVSEKELFTKSVYFSINLDQWGLAHATLHFL
jgi:hypothetical protein